MSKTEVRIVKLAPMRVMSVHAYGPSPEEEAWKKMRAWAGPRGYLGQPDHRVFGFNNPDPSPRSPDYGYELWIQVASDVIPEGEARPVDFDGGLYAVTRCVVPGQEPYNIIGDTWKALIAWREDSPYEMGSHQWLEEHVLMGELPSEGFILDLFMPLVE